MTQKLVSLNGRPLDFGLNVLFDQKGVHVEGRANSPAYKGALFEHLTANDVVESDVADDYEIPAPEPQIDQPTKDWLQVWGKKGIVTPDQFPGLVYAAYSALYRPQSWTVEQVADRVARLWDDARSSPVRETLRSPTLEHIDPNDARGNFRSMVGILLSTKAKLDNALLMTAQEMAAIATAFPDK